jgi:3-oxo-5-alpha-steroid 4-dehydrogenase 1
MGEEAVYPWILRGFVALAIVTFPVLFFVTAPYGRHGGASRLPSIDATLGWIVMESPSALGFFACFLLGDHRGDPARIALLLLWELHYVHRAFVFPFRRRGGSRTMPVPVAASAFVFTSVNSYLNGRWIFTFAPATAYGAAWLGDPRFLAGAALFLAGFALNQHADRVLFNLRKPGETGYKIPVGGFYRWVSCPNYLGEIVEWSGFALAAWSWPALAFAAWTIANLLPRAVSHHRWYREKFPDYPAERRALIPYLL